MTAVTLPISAAPTALLAAGRILLYGGAALELLVMASMLLCSAALFVVRASATGALTEEDEGKVEVLVDRAAVTVVVVVVVLVLVTVLVVLIESAATNASNAAMPRSESCMVLGNFRDAWFEC